MPKENIKIRKITWENVRNFEELTLPVGDKKFNDSTSLVQIQNGYGKTTTLYLLRSIFTSRAIDEKYIKSGYKYRYPHNKWGGDQNSPSKFYVDFEINDEFCRIGIEIDHQNMKQKFTTFREKLGGEIDGWKPPHVFRRLFEGKDDFAELFVLDGELAKELNRSTGSDVVNNSIKQVTNLAGLYTLIGSGGIDGQINRVKQERLSSIIGDAAGRGKILNGILRTVQKRIKKQNEKLGELNDLLSSIDGDMIHLNQQKDDLDKKMSQNIADLEQAKTDFDKSETDLEKISLTVLDRLFNPAFAFPKWDQAQQFHASQVKAKLPRSVGRTWFKELMDLDLCICGRKWDEHATEYVGQHLEDYLEDKLMTYVKEMQGAVAEQSSSVSLGSEIARIKEKQKQKVQNSQRVDDIRGQASTEERDEYARLDQEIGGLKERREDFLVMRNEISSETQEFIRDEKLDIDMYNNDDTITNDAVKINRILNLKCLRIVESSIIDELAQIGGAANIARGADLIHNIISEVLSKVEEEIKIELESRMNTSISRMVGAGLDGGLEVKITPNGLQYFNPNGDLQSGVNMAAELGGSYAFISALYEYAEVSIPLVLDTPLAGFGQGMSAAWTQLVPPTFDQVIALINSNEMISLKGWFEPNNIDCYLVRRTDEDVTKGMPQTGKMIIDNDLNNFANYESEVLEQGAKS
jgi:DNA sulfur modification protein DndD